MLKIKISFKLKVTIINLITKIKNNKFLPKIKFMLSQIQHPKTSLENYTVCDVQKGDWFLKDQKIKHFEIFLTQYIFYLNITLQKLHQINKPKPTLQYRQQSIQQKNRKNFIQNYIKQNPQIDNGNSFVSYILHIQIVTFNTIQTSNFVDKFTIFFCPFEGKISTKIFYIEILYDILRGTTKIYHTLKSNRSNINNQNYKYILQLSVGTNINETSTTHHLLTAHKMQKDNYATYREHVKNSFLKTNKKGKITWTRFIKIGWHKSLHTRLLNSCDFCQICQIRLKLNV
eukprot:TRINITY_DN7909_c1_g1_i2.p1 TRINITY_DN7909_c1_g1~~TRINITY_DN7909_c1_g1_i2.p1  ORF type:complete len:287 (-),score=-20.00 TRINITY_DN7909_c1_g1_i2:32-892(-)